MSHTVNLSRFLEPKCHIVRGCDFGTSELEGWPEPDNDDCQGRTVNFVQEREGYHYAALEAIVRP